MKEGQSPNLYRKQFFSFWRVFWKWFEWKLHLKHIAKSFLKSSDLISSPYRTWGLLEAMVKDTHLDSNFIMKPTQHILWLSGLWSHKVAVTS